MNNVLFQIPADIHAQVTGCRGVTPFNATLCVQQSHAVGRGLDGLQKILQALLGHVGLRFALAQQALNPLSNLCPNTLPRHRTVQVSLRQPQLNAVCFPNQDNGVDKHRKQGSEYRLGQASPPPNRQSHDHPGKNKFKYRNQHSKNP